MLRAHAVVMAPYMMRRYTDTCVAAIPNGYVLEVFPIHFATLSWDETLHRSSERGQRSGFKLSEQPGFGFHY